MVLIAVVAMLFLPCVFGGCCLPDRVSGKLNRIWIGINDTFLIDFTKNKMLQRAISERAGNHYTAVWDLEGDKHGVTITPKYPDEYKHYYSVTDLTTGTLVEYFELEDTCKKSRDMFFKHFPHCIPSNAVQIQTGAPDTETWEFKYGVIFQWNMSFRITVQKNSCSPVTATYSLSGYDLMTFEFDPNPQPDKADLDKMDRVYSNCKDDNSVIVGK